MSKETRRAVREARKGDPLRVLGDWGGGYTVRRFRPSHAAAMQQRGLDVKADKPASGRHLGLTLFKGSAVVACAGVRPLWAGVGEGWVLTSALVHECPELFTEVVQRGLDWLERNGGYHRIGAHVLDGFTAAELWAVSLGFTYEGNAPAYGPKGENFSHYGRICR